MMRRRLPLGLALCAATLTVGCDLERASVFTPLADPSYDSRLATDGRNVPNGTLTLTATAAPADTSLRLRVAGLEPLASGVYQVWLANVVAGATAGDTVLANVTPATGTVYVIQRDTTIDPVTGDPVGVDDTLSATPATSTFTAGGPATRIEVLINRASIGANVRTGFNVAFISIEAAAGAAAPSESRPLWSRYTTTAGTRNMSFGRFHPRPDSLYVFVATGRGLAGVRGPILIVDDSALARPPIGYYYATAIVKRDTVTGVPLDTLLAGPQTAPYPRRNVSLLDADINNTLDPVILVRPPSILAAATRVDARIASFGLPATTPYASYSDIWVTLETKQGIADAAPTIILSGTISGCVTRPGSC